MGNEFNISKGNILVLKTIPEMMEFPKWRKKIRMLVINYIQDSQHRRIKEEK